MFAGLKFAEWNEAENDADSCRMIEDVLDLEGGSQDIGLDFAYDPITGVPTISHIYGGNVYFAWKVDASWNFDNLGSSPKVRLRSPTTQTATPAISYVAVDFARSGRHTIERSLLHLVRWDGSQWDPPRRRGPWKQAMRTTCMIATSLSILTSSLPNLPSPTRLWMASNSRVTTAQHGTIELVDTNGGARVALAFDPTTGNPAMLHVGARDTARFVYWNGSQWEKTDLDPTALTVL